MSESVALRAAVVVSSDGVTAGTRVDKSGPLAAELLEASGFSLEGIRVVPDEIPGIMEVLREFVGAGVNLIVTSGGTGFGPRDCVPEATRMVIEREAPGFAEAVRNGSPSPFGMLTRGIAGICGKTVIVNLPGSSGGVRDGLKILVPALHHACELAKGEMSVHPEKGGASR